MEHKKMPRWSRKVPLWGKTILISSRATFSAGKKNIFMCVVMLVLVQTKICLWMWGLVWLFLLFFKILTESAQSLEVKHTSPQTGKVMDINYEFAPPAAKSFCKIKVSLFYFIEQNIFFKISFFWHVTLAGHLCTGYFNLHLQEQHRSKRLLHPSQSNRRYIFALWWFSADFHGN